MNPEIKSTLLGLLLLTLLAPGLSLADASCSDFLSAKAREAQGGWYAIELTIHREDVFSVRYGGDTVGWLVPEPDGSFVGHMDQVYSERVSEGAQPFDIRHADDVNLRLERNGRLEVSTYTAPADDSFKLACKGSMLTAYVPNYGVVTLTFRDLYRP